MSSRDAQNRHYAKKRKMVIDAKNKPCADCGQKFPHYVMDLDHLDYRQKKFNVCRFKQYSIQRVAEEISKCDVVCSNCHRIRTYDRAHADRYAVSGEMKERLRNIRTNDGFTGIIDMFPDDA